MSKIDRNVLDLFDKHLAQKSIKYRASIIGGTAIMLVANSTRATGDVDSIQKIPDAIKEEIKLFSVHQGINSSWFNDNASRNFHDFVLKGENLFATLVFSGKALTLYTPSTQTLLLSKIYPILDRPGDGKDLQDIDALIAAGVVKKSDFEAALETFEQRIRFEEDKKLARSSRVLLKALRKVLVDSFQGGQ